MTEETSLNFLFKKSIVSFPDSLNSPVFIGKNQREILFVSNNADEQSKKFLQKIVELGLKFSFDEIFFYYFPEQKHSFRELYDASKPKYIFCFGLKPSDLKMNIEVMPNVPFHFHDCEILFTVSASELERNEQTKKNFWQAMKKMLNLA